jgi:hypothetical protein
MKILFTKDFFSKLVCLSYKPLMKNIPNQTPVNIKNGGTWRDNCDIEGISR